MARWGALVCATVLAHVNVAAANRCPFGFVYDTDIEGCRHESDDHYECRIGFAYSHQKRECVERPCPSGQIFTPSYGDGRCVKATCPAGYQYDDVERMCAKVATRAYGSYSGGDSYRNTQKCTGKNMVYDAYERGCVCLPGYFRQRNGKHCNDVNECKEWPCHEYAKCKNTRGSFTCTCRKGYSGDGVWCQKNGGGYPAPPPPPPVYPTTSIRPIPPPITSDVKPTTTTKPPPPPPTTTKPTTTTTTTTTTKPTTVTPPPTPPPTPSCGSRVRKEWRSMSQRERDTYISALRTLVSRGDYRKVIPYHEASPVDMYGHQSNAFLAWHRWFLWQFEEQLRGLGGEYACVTIPFWDWTQDIKPDVTAVPSIDVVDAFGGVGSSCVTDKIIGQVRYGGSECVTRPFENGWRPAGPLEIADSIVELTTFTAYSDRIKGWHGVVHNYVGSFGATMADVKYSANDPLFFLHHAFVDKLWSMWQSCHGAPYQTNNANVAHGFDTPMPVLPGSKTPRQVESMSAMGYSYGQGNIDSNSWNPVPKCANRRRAARAAATTTTKKSANTWAEDAGLEGGERKLGGVVPQMRAATDGSVGKNGNGNGNGNGNEGTKTNNGKKPTPTMVVGGDEEDPVSYAPTVTTPTITAAATKSADYTASPTGEIPVPQLSYTGGDQVSFCKKATSEIFKSASASYAAEGAKGVLMVAAKAECKYWGGYQPVNGPWAKMLGIQGLRLPCQE